ncbi:transposase family protein [Streptomyces sp. NPDC001537]
MWRSPPIPLPGRQRMRTHPDQAPKGEAQRVGEAGPDRLARLRAPVERAFAELKRWRVLERVRISPSRIASLARAVFVIHREQRSLTRA